MPKHDDDMRQWALDQGAVPVATQDAPAPQAASGFDPHQWAISQGATPTGIDDSGPSPSVTIAPGPVPPSGTTENSAAGFDPHQWAIEQGATPSKPTTTGGFDPREWAISMGAKPSATPDVLPAEGFAPSVGRVQPPMRLEATSPQTLGPPARGPFEDAPYGAGGSPGGRVVQPTLTPYSETPAGKMGFDPQSAFTRVTHDVLRPLYNLSVGTAAKIVGGAHGALPEGLQSEAVRNAMELLSQDPAVDPAQSVGEALTRVAGGAGMVAAGFGATIPGKIAGAAGKVGAAAAKGLKLGKAGQMAGHLGTALPAVTAYGIAGQELGRKEGEGEARSAGQIAKEIAVSPVMFPLDVARSAVELPGHLLSGTPEGVMAGGPAAESVAIGLAMGAGAMRGRAKPQGRTAEQFVREGRRPTTPPVPPPSRELVARILERDRPPESQAFGPPAPTQETKGAEGIGQPTALTPATEAGGGKPGGAATGAARPPPGPYPVPKSLKAIQALGKRRAGLETIRTGIRDLETVMATVYSEQTEAASSRPRREPRWTVPKEVYEARRKLEADWRSHAVPIKIDEHTTLYVLPTVKELEAKGGISPKALAAKMGKVKWQDKPTKARKPSKVGTPKPPASIIGRKKPATPTDIALTLDRIPAVSVSGPRYPTDSILIEPGRAIATDGKRLFVIEGDFKKLAGQGDAGLLYSDLAGKGRPQTEKESFPRIDDFVPPLDRAHQTTIDVAEHWRHIRRAQIMTNEESQGVGLVKNADGSIGYVAGIPQEGTVEINTREGGVLAVAVNPGFWREALEFHLKNGETAITVQIDSPTQPVTTRGGKGTTVTMPINIEHVSGIQGTATTGVRRGKGPPGASGAASVGTTPIEPDLARRIKAEAPAGEMNPLTDYGKVDLPTPSKDFGPAVMEAARLLAAPARYKRLRGMMLGVFRWGAGKPKIELGDIRWTHTGAHELGHAVDFRISGDSFPSSIKKRFGSLTITEKAARVELKAASEFYRPLPEGRKWGDKSSHMKYRTRHSELMADLFGLYAHDPAKARQLAPNVTAAMEAKIQQRPDILNAVRTVIEPGKAVLKSPAQVVVTGRGRTPPPIPPDELSAAQPNPQARKDAFEIVKATTRKHAGWMHEVEANVRNWTANLSEKQREDIGAYVEGIGNVRVKGDTPEAVAKRMTPEMRRIAQHYRFEQEAVRQEVNKLLHDVEGTPEHIKYVEDYLAHFYVRRPGDKSIRSLYTKWRKTTPHSKRRTFPTYAEAVEAGFEPVTQDIAYNYRRAAENNVRAAVTREALAKLKVLSKQAEDSGQPPLIVPNLEQAAQFGADYVRIDHPVLRRVYARKTKGGKLILGEGSMWVHPDLERPIKVLLDKPFTGPVWGAIRAVNSLGKSINVSFSVFHEFALYESSQAMLARAWNPLRGVFIGPFESKRLGLGFRPHRTYKAGLLIDANDPLGIREGIEAGLSMSRPAAADYARSYLEGGMRKAEAWTRRVPVLGHVTRKVRQALESYNRHLWDNTHVGMKLLAYHTLAKEILPDLPVGYTERQARETIASFVNDAFGGQEFLEVPTYRKGHGSQFEPMTSKEKQIAHAVVFAPDWTWSNIRVAGRSLPHFRPGGDPVQRKLAIRYWRNMALTLAGSATLAQRAIHVLAGDDSDHKKYPWQNEIGHEWDVDVTPLIAKWRKMVGLAPPERRAYVHAGKQAREVLRYFSDFPKGIIGQAGSKSSVGVRLLWEQMSGHQIGSGFPMPWADNAFRGEMRGWERIVAQARAAGEHFLPFSWQPNNFAFALPRRTGMSSYKAMRYYADAIEYLVNPTAWDRIKGAGDLDKRRRATDDIFRQIDDAARINGFDEDARRRLFGYGRGRVRSKYYGRFFDALDAKKIEQADHYANILLRLNVESGNLEQSSRQRGRSEGQTDTALDRFDAAKELPDWTLDYKQAG